VRRDSVRSLFFVALTGLSIGIACAQPPAQPKHETKQGPAAPVYEITGVVINSVDGAPVPHCHLTPTLIGRGGSSNRQNFGNRQGFGNRQFPTLASEFDCDGSGHFTVILPTPGTWHLIASARGFVSGSYDEHPPYFSGIVLTPEAATMDVEFRISPEASIVGLVVDEAGEPVRNAQIALQTVPPPSPSGPQPVGNMRGGARTDDRGVYELANLSPGDYRVSVHAVPWYAAGGQMVRGANPDVASLDPLLDYAYPQTWFPGVSDPAQAETIVLHAGDTRQADFHLIPIPSIHLRIVPPPRVTVGTNTPAPQPVPMIQQVNAVGGQNFVQTSVHIDGQGQIDVSGLTPGVYQVRLAGPNMEGHAAMVEVTPNSLRTLDLSAPSRDLARITLRFDGLADMESGPRGERNGGVQVSLIDRDNRNGSFSSNGGEGAGFNPGRRDQREPNADRVLEVPPGRYEVVLQGRPNLFLTGLTAKGAETAGRYVTVGAGESTLTVHVASGRASLSGVATLGGKPAAGAMVLLVPITIEDPNSIAILLRDETNTDGTFDLTNIIPGQYILVAIDHGWQINWGDPSTLRHYLMQGVPVELKSSAIVKQNIPAQAP
jgi:hypothetical protein